MSRAAARRVWTIVLAGGEGERLRPLTEAWLGRHVPKQYCTFVGTRSMLEHTLDRAGHLSPPERIVTVMAHRHLPLIARSHRALTRGKVLLQPENRDTGPGVFLALAPVHRADPSALVVLLPSDHFVYPEERFVRQIRAALRAAEVLDRVVVLGAVPDHPEPEYGWIEPGNLLEVPNSDLRAHRVSGFTEKPTETVARSLQASGALWNTMILVGSVQRLWAMGRRWLPDVVERIEDVEETLGSTRQRDALEEIYRDMPVRNLSRDLLEPAATELVVMTLAGVQWSDWGSARRIATSLARLGKRPPWQAQTGGRAGWR